MTCRVENVRARSRSCSHSQSAEPPHRETIYTLRIHNMTNRSGDFPGQGACACQHAPGRRCRQRRLCWRRRHRVWGCAASPLPNRNACCVCSVISWAHRAAPFGTVSTPNTYTAQNLLHPQLQAWLLLLLLSLLRSRWVINFPLNWVLMSLARLLARSLGRLLRNGNNASTASDADDELLKTGVFSCVIACPLRTTSWAFACASTLNRCQRVHNFLWELGEYTFASEDEAK